MQFDVAKIQGYHEGRRLEKQDPDLRMEGEQTEGAGEGSFRISADSGKSFIGS